MSIIHFPTLYVYVLCAAIVAAWNPGQAQMPHVFTDGLVLKVPVGKGGVFKIPGAWLASQSGLSITELDKQRIRVFGDAGGPLTESFDDLPGLKELAVAFNGGNSGTLGASDYMVIYASSPDKFRWDETTGSTQNIKNPFADQNFVFIKIGGATSSPVRVEYRTTQETGGCTVFSDEQFYHEDRVNLLGIHPVAQGSGQQWFGQEISNLGFLDVSSFFHTEDWVEGKEVVLVAEVAVRSNKEEDLSLDLNSKSAAVSVLPVDIGDVEARHARVAQLSVSGQWSSDQRLGISFQKNAENARAWLDFAKLTSERRLQYRGGLLKFTNRQNGGTICEQMRIETGGRTPVIWDVTNPIRPVEVVGLREGSLLDIACHDGPRNILAFDPEDLPIPKMAEVVNHQDIHAIDGADMLIIYHEAFKNQVMRLAEHRGKHSGLKIKTVEVSQVFNAYGSGRRDPGAIRNFCRDLWLKDPGFRYLLLFGDASYDYRGIDASLDFENFVPTYETRESLDPLLAFPSDDFYGLLDDQEHSELNGDLDIAVGRIPVRTLQEAKAVVDKIVHYDKDAKTRGIWRTRIAFLADDEDNNLHLNDADQIAREVKDRNPLFHQQKIYWDAFPQVSTPGGNRYPAANAQLTQLINEGVAVVNYLGHGGPRGWSQERVLHLDDVDSWTNFSRLPLIITATCSFTGFDDPSITTAGEAVFLNPSGGAIALFTTVRSVFASKNFRLTRSVFQELFESGTDGRPALGDIFVRAKNKEQNINSRKFLMIGDPSMQLALPLWQIRTTSINGKLPTEGIAVDTVGALDRVSLEGIVIDHTGQLVDDFHGEVDVMVYDKASTVTTLRNDPGSFKKSFEIQQNILFRGKAVVEKGKFKTEWVVPLDIDYKFGPSRIAYYATGTGGSDAAGATESLWIGGAGTKPVADDTPPVVTLELDGQDSNDRIITGPNPVVVARVIDDTGINLSSAGIGHEMAAVLDGDRNNTIYLTGRFEPSLNDGTSGKVVFQLRELAEGMHHLKMVVFDVANQAGEATVTFEVNSKKAQTFSNLTVFPNPTQDQSTFRFNHSLGIASFAARIEIYDMLGRLSFTSRQRVISQNGTVDDLTFSDSFGHLPDGMYLFRIVAELDDGDFFSGFEKMMILK